MTKKAADAVRAEMDKIAASRCEKHGEHSIQLDSPPGSTRPWELIAGVCKDTGLTPNTDSGAFFGARTWYFADIPCDRWDEIQQITKPRITALYNSGTIRYGSW